MNSCRFGPKSRNHDPTRWDGWALTLNRGVEWLLSKSLSFRNGPTGADAA
jgi:hypothetical protein